MLESCFFSPRVNYYTPSSCLTGATHTLPTKLMTQRPLRTFCSLADIAQTSKAASTWNNQTQSHKQKIRYSESSYRQGKWESSVPLCSHPSPSAASNCFPLLCGRLLGLVGIGTGAGPVSTGRAGRLVSHVRPPGYPASLRAWRGGAGWGGRGPGAAAPALWAFSRSSCCRHRHRLRLRRRRRLRLRRYRRVWV